jgi:hypothetical protein
MPLAASQRPSTLSSLGMSEIAEDISLVITGNNIDLTPALQEYVEKRIGGLLNKLGSGGIVRECDVHLSVCKNPKVRSERGRERQRLKHGETVFSSTYLILLDCLIFMDFFLLLLYLVFSRIGQGWTSS